MGKKKSLGHNPLAYSMMGHASFDFIPSQEQNVKENESKEKEDHETHKITASYYLEEPLVTKIKNIAKKKNQTYSATVSNLLKKSLKELKDNT